MTAPNPTAPRSASAASQIPDNATDQGCEQDTSLLLCRAFWRGIGIALVIILVLGVVIVACCSGCQSTPKPSATHDYPITNIVDTVTEVTPDVIYR